MKKIFIALLCAVLLLAGCAPEDQKQSQALPETPAEQLSEGEAQSELWDELEEPEEYLDIAVPNAEHFTLQSLLSVNGVALEDIVSVESEILPEGTKYSSTDAEQIAEIWVVMGDMPVTVAPRANPSTGGALGVTLHLAGNKRVDLWLAGVLEVNGSGEDSYQLADDHAWDLQQYIAQLNAEE